MILLQVSCRAYAQDGQTSYDGWYKISPKCGSGRSSYVCEYIKYKWHWMKALWAHCIVTAEHAASFQRSKHERGLLLKLQLSKKILTPKCPTNVLKNEFSWLHVTAIPNSQLSGMGQIPSQCHSIISASWILTHWSFRESMLWTGREFSGDRVALVRKCKHWRWFLLAFPQFVNKPDSTVAG